VPLPSYFHGYDLPVSGEQGLQSHQICDFFQVTKSDPLGFASQTGSLNVGKSRSFPSALLHHFLQDSDFLLQLLDDLQLLAAHPD
jgi:hypothetical protein